MKYKTIFKSDLGDIEFDSCEEFFVNEEKITVSFFTEDEDGYTVFAMRLKSKEKDKTIRTSQLQSVQCMAMLLHNIKNGTHPVRDF